MEDIDDFAMAFPDVLGNFQHYSRSYYIVCAAVTVFVDFIVVFLLAARKFPRNGLKSNHVMLLNLVLCDILYEASTTTLFLQSNSCEVVENCKMLYFIYLALNLCTVFHIMVEIMQKTILDFGRASHDASLTSRVYWSVVSWVGAFALAYVDFKNESGLMNASAMAFLGRFKGFGYLLFAVILCSGILVILLTVAIAKPHIKTSPFENSHAPETSRREIGFAVNRGHDDLIFSCIFMAIFVGWCAWVVLGVDSRIMKTVEVMKSFEAIRLAGRILNPLTILYSFSHRNEQFVLREP
jgi:hypothetical protein